MRTVQSDQPATNLHNFEDPLQLPHSHSTPAPVAIDKQSTYAQSRVIGNGPPVTVILRQTHSISCSHKVLSNITADTYARLSRCEVMSRTRTPSAVTASTATSDRPICCKRHRDQGLL